MDAHEVLGQLVAGDRWRMGVLRLICDLSLPDGFVTGGFVRNMVWDHLHGRPMTPLNNVDVIYFDAERPDPAVDRNLEHELSFRSPKKTWSVVNVAAGDSAPASIEDAVRRGPETATAVAIAVDHHDNLTVIAPYGLEDLFDGVVRPVSEHAVTEVHERAASKRWQKLYPRLRLET